MKYTEQHRRDIALALQHEERDAMIAKFPHRTSWSTFTRSRDWGQLAHKISTRVGYRVGINGIRGAVLGAHDEDGQRYWRECGRGRWFFAESDQRFAEAQVQRHKKTLAKHFGDVVGIRCAESDGYHLRQIGDPQLITERLAVAAEVIAAARDVVNSDGGSVQMDELAEAVARLSGWQGVKSCQG